MFSWIAPRFAEDGIEINWEWNERQRLAEDFAEELCQSGNCGG